MKRSLSCWTLKPDCSAQQGNTCSTRSELIQGMTPVMSLERVQMLRFLLTDEALANIREAIQFWLEVEAEEDSVKTVETFEVNV